MKKLIFAAFALLSITAQAQRELTSGSHSTVINLPDDDGAAISFDTTNGVEISDFTFTLRKI